MKIRHSNMYLTYSGINLQSKIIKDQKRPLKGQKGQDKIFPKFELKICFFRKHWNDSEVQTLNQFWPFS